MNKRTGPNKHTGLQNYYAQNSIKANCSNLLYSTLAKGMENSEKPFMQRLLGICACHLLFKVLLELISIFVGQNQ